MEKSVQNSLALYVVLSRAFRAVMDYCELDIRESNLNPTEFAVLELLYHKGPHPLQQIGERILLASGSITYVVDKLEHKGYVIREACPKDRRIIHATITAEGEALMESIFPKHAEAIAAALSGLTDAEQVQAKELMKKMGLKARALHDAKVQLGSRKK